jgi:hypothetical protein
MKLKKLNWGCLFLGCLLTVDACIKVIDGSKTGHHISILSGIIEFLAAIILGIMALKGERDKET